MGKKGSENKLALYFTHDWDVTNKLNLYYGARLEWQKLKGENAAVKNANGDFVGRFAETEYLRRQPKIRNDSAYLA